jgi:allophanate hydrolase subunit 2
VVEVAAGLLVINPGLCSTVQDRGRPGHREFGVPVGGAFDLDSLALANALLGNDRDAAAIELTVFGGIYRATRRLGLALAGAPFDVAVNSASGRRSILVPQSFGLEPGEDLSIGGAARGARVYLAVKGGWRTLPILGSRSTEIPLEPGSLVPARSGTSPFSRPSAIPWPDPSLGPIRLLDGPDGPVPTALLEHGFRVASESDRTGIRLEGPMLAGLEIPSRASAPVATGAVQVAGGRPIILGVAGGTMGGYPHVAHVIAADLDRLGQARPGQVLQFTRVGLEEAIRLDGLRRERLAEREARIGVAALALGGD